MKISKFKSIAIVVNSLAVILIATLGAYLGVFKTTNFPPIINNNPLNEHLRLPSSSKNNIKTKIFEKFGSTSNDKEKYISFLNSISNGSNKAYREVEGVELKEDYSSLSVEEIKNIILNYIIKNYQQYTEKAQKNLENGVGLYKLFDPDDETYKVFGLINYVDKTLEELKALEENNPQEFFNLYREAWTKKIYNDIESFSTIPINKAQYANSLMKKDDPQIRNNYNFFCNFSLEYIPPYNAGGRLFSKSSWKKLYLDKENEEDNIIVCALLRLPTSSSPKVSDITNQFPLIAFKNLNWDLANKGINLADRATTAIDRLNKKLENEEKARKAAKLIADNLLKSLSFSSELINLDMIVFNLFTDGDASGVYSHIHKEISLQPFFNIRILNLFVQRIINTERTAYSPGYIPYGEKDLENISFDIYETLKTLAHEYGHHVTLENGLFDSVNFLDELKKVFYKDGNNLPFNDFVEMYKYFNAMNDDDNLNYVKTGNGVVINAGATRALALYRKYYSYHVRTLYDLIYNTTFGFTTSQILRNLIASLEKEQSQDIYHYNRALYETVFALSVGRDVAKNKELAKTFYLEYYEHNKHLKGKPSIPYRPKYWIEYRYVPDSFEINDRSSQLKVRDIFPNMKTVDYSTNEEISDFSCLDDGYNFHGRIYNYHIYLLGRKKFASTEQYKEKSIEADKDFLSWFQYFFSTNELLARMHSILTYKYPDGRSYINQCSFETDEREGYVNKRLKLDNTNFEDYGFFRSFGMNLLEGDNEITLYKMLTHKQDLSNNQGKVYKNKAKGASDTYPNQNPVDELPFSISIRSVNPTGDDPDGFADIYLILNLKLVNPEDAFLIKLQYQLGDPITPFFYDYNNAVLVKNDVDDNIENPDNLQLSTPFSSSNEAYKYVSLVFRILKIQGIQSSEERYNLVTRINGQVINYNLLKENFQWSSENDRPILFLDKNANDLFDEGDIELSFE